MPQVNAGKADREKQLAEQTQARRTANVSDAVAHKRCFITAANNDLEQVQQALELCCATSREPDASVLASMFDVNAKVT